MSPFLKAVSAVVATFVAALSLLIACTASQPPHAAPVLPTGSHSVAAASAPSASVPRPTQPTPSAPAGTLPLFPAPIPVRRHYVRMAYFTDSLGLDSHRKDLSAQPYGWYRHAYMHIVHRRLEAAGYTGNWSRHTWPGRGPSDWLRETPSDLPERIRNESALGATVFVVQLGVNDFLHQLSPQAALASYWELIRFVRATAPPEAAVVLLNVAPCHAFVGHADLWWQQVNTGIAEVAAAHRCILVDVGGALLEAHAAVDFRTEVYFHDTSCHPNMRGKWLMANTTADAIARPPPAVPGATVSVRCGDVSFLGFRFAPRWPNGTEGCRSNPPVSLTASPDGRSVEVAGNAAVPMEAWPLWAAEEAPDGSGAVTVSVDGVEVAFDARRGGVLLPPGARKLSVGGGAALRPRRLLSVPDARPPSAVERYSAPPVQRRIPCPVPLPTGEAAWRDRVVVVTDGAQRLPAALVSNGSAVYVRAGEAVPAGAAAYVVAVGAADACAGVSVGAFAARHRVLLRGVREAAPQALLAVLPVDLGATGEGTAACRWRGAGVWEGWQAAANLVAAEAAMAQRAVMLDVHSSEKLSLFERVGAAQMKGYTATAPCGPVHFGGVLAYPKCRGGPAEAPVRLTIPCVGSSYEFGGGVTTTRMKLFPGWAAYHSKMPRKGIYRFSNVMWNNSTRSTFVSYRAYGQHALKVGLGTKEVTIAYVKEYF